MGKKSRKGWTIDPIIEMIGVLTAALILGFMLGSFFGDDISSFLHIDPVLWRVILYCLLGAYVIGNVISISRQQRKMKLAGVLESNFEKEFPSTPFRLFLDNLYHAKWGIVICVCCIFTLIPVIIFMKDVEVIKSGPWETTISSTGPPILRVVFLLYLVDLFALAKSFKTMKDIYDEPFKRTYQSFKDCPLILDNDVTRSSILKELSYKIGVKPPKLLLTATPVSLAFPKSFVLGETEEKAQIVFYRYYLDSLELEEFEAVAAHELFHAKTNIELNFAQIVEPKYLLWYFLGQVLLLASGIFALIPLADATSSISWPFRVTEPILGTPISLLANPVVFSFSVVPVIIGIFVALSGVIVHPDLFQYAFVSWEQEEYFCDSMSVLLTKQPKPLIHALLKDLLLTTRSKKPSKKLLEDYYDSEEFALDLQNYKMLLQPSYLKEEQTVVNRIKQARLIETLVDRGICVSAKRKVTNFGSFSLFGLNPGLYFSPFARALNKIDNHDRKKVYDYIQNTNKFNLRSCAESTQLTPNDAFVVFACLLMAEVIE